jgi:hypothetical protein
MHVSRNTFVFLAMLALCATCNASALAQHKPSVAATAPWLAQGTQAGKAMFERAVLRATYRKE